MDLDLITDSLTVNVCIINNIIFTVFPRNTPRSIVSITFNEPVNYIKIIGALTAYNVSPIIPDDTFIYLSLTANSPPDYTFCPQTIKVNNNNLGQIWDASDIYAYTTTPFTVCYLMCNYTSAVSPDSFTATIKGTQLVYTNGVKNILTTGVGTAIVVGVPTQ